MASRLTVLSGPSGVGKGSVVQAVRRRHPDIWVSISATTRSPRPGERHGVEYFFVDKDEFRRMRTADELLESACYAGNCYGTPRAAVAEQLEQGVPALLEIELQGARQIRDSMPEAQLVFLAPPSWRELERRLSARATEPVHVVRQRLEVARDELAAEGEFDAVVINDEIEAAADRLVALMLD
ncbi:MAG TPA: guanylate kinase [Frankiaceae bacterium]|nr:guanylate kinase [Frankiaceae bacterium]